MKYLKIFIFSVVLIDLVVMSIVLHEYVHKFDYRNIEKFNEKMCILDCDGNAGYYSFEYYLDEENYQKYLEISKYTEFHAYFADFIWSFVSYFILKKILNFYKRI
jgi:hypothetical protein